MNKCIGSTRLVFFLGMLSLFVGCGSIKKKTEITYRLIGAPVEDELENPVLENIELSLSGVLALSHTGKVKMNLYEKNVEISFLNGGVYLKPKFEKNEAYDIQSMDVGLGKYTTGKSWRVYNKSPKLFLNKTVKNKNDTLQIANTKFYIHYNNPTDLRNAWISVTYYNTTGKKVYNHSQKLGHYFEDYIATYENEKLQKDYSKKSSEELIRKQFEIQKNISYEKAKYYLKGVKEGKSFSALYKMNFRNRTNNWERNPELSADHLKYKKATDSYKKYRNENSDYLENLNLYKEKKISKDEYLKRSRAIFDSLKALDYDTYTRLSKAASDSSRALWLQTGEFYLKEYKFKEKMFPSEWIEEKYIKGFIESSYYKSLQRELEFIEKEIIKRI